MSENYNELYNSGIWQKNCDYLKNKNSFYYHKLLSLDHNLSSKIKFEQSKRGFVNVAFESKNGNYRYLHSKYDPFKEAVRFVQELDIEPTQNLVLFGLGLGFHLFDILKHQNKPSWITVIEGDLRYFWAFAHLKQIDFLFETPKLNFLLQPSEEKIFSCLQSDTFSILANGIKIVKHQAACQDLRSYYASLESKINDFSSWARANILTQIKASDLFSENILFNIRAKLKSIPFKLFNRVFDGIPAVIVSGGPSLSKNGHLLKKAKEKAIIFCVDTALRFLIENEIEPDFIVSTDFTQNATQYFDDVDTEKPVLLVDAEVCPEVVKKYKGPISFCDIEGKSLCQWLKTVLGDYGDIAKGISVSHTAFSAAEYVGANPLIFIGQDLAFTNNQTHVKGATHGVNVEADESYITVDGLFSKVKTSKSLKVFLDHFQDLIASAQIKVIDSTEGGAIIKGTEVKTLREVLINLNPLTFSLKEKIEQVIHQKSNQNISEEKVIIYIKQAQDKIKLLNQFAQELKSNLQKVLSTIDNQPAIAVTAYEKFYRQSAKMSDYIPVLEIIRDNLTEAFMIRSKRFNVNWSDLDSVNNKQNAKKMIRSNAIYYDHIIKTTGIIDKQLQGMINQT